MGHVTGGMKLVEVTNKNWKVSTEHLNGSTRPAAAWLEYKFLQKLHGRCRDIFSMEAEIHEIGMVQH